ncbi:hypothetical protein [Vibrio phage vB_VibM_10AMN]|uniref:Uncharacterized protein n=2 Tax=unclassified Caudoviricetes TaxID=2788787 RepID=A0AA96KTF0_9CAUD|nr:hypothetical protein [Vibrio phage vB_VibM_10AMN]WNO47475.1 hypothetical protein [Staphylococcus phage vB_VibM_10AMN12]
MSSVNTDLIIGILSEKHPDISTRMIERLVNNSKQKEFQKIMDEVEGYINLEHQKEVTPPLRPQRKHLLDFSRNW